MLLLKFIFTFYIFSLSCFHPVHVSVTSMELNKEKSAIEYSVKVFKDDFQLLFYHLNKLSVDFDDTISINKNKSVIDKYFERNIVIKINQKEIVSQMVDFSVIDDAIWFNFKAQINSEILSIELINTVLLDLYLDQKNLLIFKAEDFEKGYRFDLNHSKHLIEF